MKTLSGKVVSSSPISLYKASNALSNFVSGDTGASQAVSAYLRRATSAFDELVQLHKDLKPLSRKPALEDAARAEIKRSKKRKSEERQSGVTEPKMKEKKNKKKKRRVESEQ